jgi:hypothetical protein
VKIIATVDYVGSNLVEISCLVLVVDCGADAVVNTGVLELQDLKLDGIAFVESEL